MAVTLLLVAGAWTWAALVLSGPLLPDAIAGPLYAVSSLLCHQRSDRSLFVSGAQLPVCARCTAIYMGAALGALRAGAHVGDTGSLLARGLTPGLRRARIVLVLAALPTVLSVVGEQLGIIPSSNVLRAAASAPFGIAVGFVGVAVLGGLHYDRCAPRPPIAPSRPPTST